MEELDKVFQEWLEVRNLGKPVVEAMQTHRYSVEVNYRTSLEEVMDNYAKLILGYASAGMKNCGYHCKLQFNAKPFRIFVSTRNWDDGEWVATAYFDHAKYHFIICPGTYNKERKSVALTQESMKKCDGTTAADIVKSLRNLMEDLKRRTPLGSQTLNPVKLKRGPKPVNLKKANKKII